MQLQDAIRQYWKARQRDFSPNTTRDYELTFSRLVSFLGDGCEMEAINSGHLNDFLNHVQEVHHLGPKTLCNHWIALSSLWSWAETELDLRHIMRGKVKRPKVRKRQTEAYSADELRDMLAVCARSKSYSRPGKAACTNSVPLHLRDRAIILALLDSGMRASECVDLKLCDYDRNRGKLTIQHGKGDKPRTVYVGIRAQKAMSDYLTTRPDAGPDDPLFVNRWGAALTRSGLLQFVVRLGERAGVHDAGVHRFRHTFGINFLRNGGGELALQDLLGHEDLSTTRIYAHLASNDLEVQAKSNSPADNWRL